MIRCMLEDESEKTNYNFKHNQYKIKTEFIDTQKPRGTKRNPAVSESRLALATVYRFT